MVNIDVRPLNENGKKHGEWTTYFESGAKSFVSNHFHGIEHGVQMSFEEDGEIDYIANYHMGVPKGFFLIYEDSWHGEDDFNKQKQYYLCLI